VSEIDVDLARPRKADVIVVADAALSQGRMTPGCRFANENCRVVGVVT
jgi:hypothetical protein